MSSLNNTKWFRMACVEPEVRPGPLFVWPLRISWPDYVETGDSKHFTVTVSNSGNDVAHCLVSATEESPTSAWLSTDASSFTVEPDGQTTFDIIITAPAGGPQYLKGTVTIESDDPSNPEFPIGIDVWSADSIAEPNIYDTVATSNAWSKGLGDDIALIVSNHGEVGHGGIGLVNMDFVQSGTDCDSSATVYLNSGSPFVLVKSGDSVSGTTSHYSTSVGTSNPMTWVPLPGYPVEGGTGAYYGGPSPVEFDSVFTGKMANRDSTLWLERTFFAPRNNTSNPSFIMVRTRLGTYVGIADSLMIGDIIDWDVPSIPDGISSVSNIAGVVGTGEDQIAYVQGTDTAGDMSGCIENAKRFATAAFYARYSNDYHDSGSSVCWNSWVMPVRDTGSAAPTGLFDRDSASDDYQYGLWWDSLLSHPGNVATDLRRDLGQFMTYDILDGLGIHDTITYIAIWVTGYDVGDATDLQDNVMNAREFADRLFVQCGGCCCGLRGNVDGLGGDTPTLGDLSALIDILFISLHPPDCPAEANVDGIGPDTPAGITLGDLTALIDVLFISLDPPPPCP